jgi:hypothetical protein
MQMSGRKKGICCFNNVLKVKDTVAPDFSYLPKLLGILN